VKTLCRFCIVLSVVALTNRNSAGNPQPQTDRTESRSGIPFKLYGNYLIVIEGRIGDLGQLRFVVDTGVTHSVIDRQLAGRMGVARRSGKVLNFDKTVPAEWTEVAEVQFGPIDVAHFSMMVGDLRYFQSFAANIDAVIGLDLLRLSSFSIDYEARKIFFRLIDMTSGIPMSSGPICLSVQLQVGDGELRVVVDTGAQALVLYENRVLGRIGQFSVAGETDGPSVGGNVHAKRATLARARLGTTDLDKSVFLVKAPPENVLPGIDGYLGTDTLKARRIDFNFETNTLTWKR
jgi:predicted aspartyl protease